MSDWKIFEATATEVLIEYVQGNTQNSATSDNAFLALMFRFRLDLLQKCERICKNRGYDKEVAQVIAERTFSKYGRSKKFKVAERKYDCVDTSFKVYLYKIASNELNNYFREEEKRKNGQLYDGTENIVTEIPNLDLARLSDEARIIHETLLALPYSHQVVYLTYKVHEREGVNLPKVLLVKLREHLGGISQGTIRGYKKEANDKIESARKIIQQLS